MEGLLEVARACVDLLGRLRTYLDSILGMSIYQLEVTSFQLLTFILFNLVIQVLRKGVAHVRKYTKERWASAWILCDSHPQYDPKCH